jgi:hypothetical protein
MLGLEIKPLQVWCEEQHYCSHWMCPKLCYYGWRIPNIDWTCYNVFWLLWIYEERFVRSSSHSHYLDIDGKDYIGMIIRSDVMWSSLSLLPFCSTEDHPFGFVTFKRTISCKAHETTTTNHECLALWFLTCLWFALWSFDKNLFWWFS